GLREAAWLIRSWRSVSELCDLSLHILTRTSETKGHRWVCDSSAAFNLTSLTKRVVRERQIGGTSDRWHERVRLEFRPGGPELGVRQCLSLQGRKNRRWRRFSPPFAESSPTTTPARLRPRPRCRHRRRPWRRRRGPRRHVRLLPPRRRLRSSLLCSR